MQARIFRFIADICYRKPRLVTLIVLVSAMGAAFAVTQLELQTELEDLLPEDSQVVQEYFGMIEQFGLAEHVILYVDAEEPLKLEVVGEFVQLLAQNIKQLPTVERLDYQFNVEEFEELETLLLKSLPLFLSEKQLDELITRLAADELQTQMERARRLLLSEASIEMNRIITEDPLTLLLDFTSGFVAQNRQFNMAMTDGYYLSDDQTKLFMLLKVKGIPQDMAFDRELDEGLKGAIARAEQEFRSRGSLQGIAIKYTGPHIVVIHESQVIKVDVIITAVGSFFGVLLLFLAAFRRPATLLYVGLPLAVGILWTLAIGYLSIGSLNLLTSVCTAITLGLGIDFAIHIYSRYLDERAQGNDSRRALQESLVLTGPAIVTGAFTTAIAFYAMILTDFQGLAQFGFMTGTGILCCFLAITILLPALLSWREKILWRPYHYKQMADFWLGKIPRLVANHYLVILGLSLGLTLASLAFFPRVRFNDDLQAIRSTNNPALRIQEEVQKLLGSSMKPVVLLIRAPNEETVMELSEAALLGLQANPVFEQIAWIDSLQRYLPPPSHQRAALAWLSEKRDLLPLTSLKADFREAVAKAGLRYLASYDSYIDGLVSGLQSDDMLKLENLNTGILELLLNRYLVHDQDGYQAVTYIYPKQKLNSRKAAREFMDQLELALQGIPDRSFTGFSLLTLELKERIHRSFKKVTIWVALGVFATLMLSFRSLFRTLLAMMPIALGLIWLVGAMGLAGLEFNYINIAVTPMIIGIGIDYGIHLLHRYLKSDRNIARTIQLTGKAIVMTSLTTIAGFGSLALANYKGIASMGIVTMLGIGFCLLAALFTLPALLVFLDYRNNGKADTPPRGQE